VRNDNERTRTGNERTGIGRTGIGRTKNERETGQTGQPGRPDGHAGGLTGQAVVGLLATTQRLRVVAAVVLGAATAGEIATATGLTEAEVGAALNRLVRGRLVSVVDGRFEVDPRVFADAARSGAPRREPVDYGVNDPKVAAVLHSFLVDGRLVGIPARGRKRTAVLEYLVATFEPGRKYPEREVNAILASFHADTASLRRYLVDEGFLSRGGGLYWRSGGWVDVL
jgi:hypothetical protein